MFASQNERPEPHLANPTMIQRIVSTLLVALMVSMAADRAAAQARQQNRPQAFTNPTDAGADYQLQGESAGWSYSAGRGTEFTGLQIVALGNGKFNGVEYRGGLPGNGWDRSSPIKLSGEVQNGRLTLNGQGQQLQVADFFAVAV